MPFTPRKTALLFIIIAIAVFVESCIPYICAERNTPTGYHFSGQVAYVPDQNMYFSFISQARDGAFILKNKLTAIPHTPVFINLEFWAVGFIQRVTGMSENAVFQTWRLMGIVLLTIGFYMLARVSLKSPRRQVLAFAAFLCTGGFGFLFGLLGQFHLLSFDATQSGIIDMRYGMLPFQQIITNPHFAFPHGLILIAYAFFIIGEQNGKLKNYIYSGLMFTIIGLVRPYDIIPPVIIFPLYALVINGSLRFELLPLLRRMLPLFMIIPVFLYNVWLFKYNEIFKYWSLQGHNSGSMPSVFWHYLVYGVGGLLAIVRLVQIRRFPPGNLGIFMLLWFGVTFVFIHLGQYLPAIGWSPQIGVYLAAPLTIAAFSVHLDGIFKEKTIKLLVVPVVSLFIILSNLSILLYFSRDRTGGEKTEIFYTNNFEVAALNWLKGNTHSGQVVLAGNEPSPRIAKYTSANVVAAHYSVTPKFAEFTQIVERIYADSMMMSGQRPLPDQLHAAYIYYKPGPWYRPILKGKYLTEVFKNEVVYIYKVND